MLYLGNTFFERGNEMVRPIRVLLLSAVLSVPLNLFSFMAAAAEGPAAQGSVTLQKVRVGVLKIGALTNAYVARDLGMFKKYGLDVELVDFRGASESVPAMQAGKIELSLIILGFAMIANEQGFDMVAVIQNETSRDKPPDSGAIVVRKDSGIQRLTDLRGKRLAVNSLHSQDTVSAQYIIKKAGVPLDAVRFIEAPFPSHADLLRSGQVDAVATIDPFRTRIQREGTGTPIAWTFVDAIPEQPIAAFWAKRAWVKQNGKIVEAFISGLLDSMAYLNADPKRARGLIAKYTGLDPSFLVEMPLIVWNPRIDRAKWQAVIQMLREMNELRQDHRADEYFSDSIKRFIAR